MKKYFLLITLFNFILILYCSAQTPVWYNDEMNRQVGNWITDNSAYMSEEETDDRYGIRWNWGVGKKSLIGVLYGMKDGSLTQEYWQFIQYWDEENDQAKVIQIASFGLTGEGYLEQIDEHNTQLVQLFSSADGTSFKSGHKTTIQENQEISISFDIDDENNWIKKRTYIWVKESP